MNAIIDAPTNATGSGEFPSSNDGSMNTTSTSRLAASPPSAPTPRPRPSRTTATTNRSTSSSTACPAVVEECVARAAVAELDCVHEDAVAGLWDGDAAPTDSLLDDAAPASGRSPVELELDDVAVDRVVD